MSSKSFYRHFCFFTNSHSNSGKINKQETHFSEIAQKTIHVQNKRPEFSYDSQFQKRFMTEGEYLWYLPVDAYLKTGQ